MTRPYAAPISPGRLLAAFARMQWRAWRQRRAADAGWSPLDEPEENP